MTAYPFPRYCSQRNQAKLKLRFGFGIKLASLPVFTAFTLSFSTVPFFPIWRVFFQLLLSSCISQRRRQTTRICLDVWSESRQLSQTDTHAHYFPPESNTTRFVFPSPFSFLFKLFAEGAISSCRRVEEYKTRKYPLGGENDFGSFQFC